MKTITYTINTTITATTKTPQVNQLITAPPCIYTYRDTDPREDDEYLVTISDSQIENPFDFHVMKNGDVWVLCGINADSEGFDDDLYVKLPPHEDLKRSHERGDLNYEVLRDDLAAHYPSYDVVMEFWDR